MANVELTATTPGVGPLWSSHIRTRPAVFMFMFMFMFTLGEVVRAKQRLHHKVSPQ